MESAVFARLLREFEELPVRRITPTTVVMERGPLDSWRARCGAAILTMLPNDLDESHGFEVDDGSEV